MALIAEWLLAEAVPSGPATSPDPGSSGDLLLPSPGFDEAPFVSSGNMAGSIVWVVVALALVIGLIFLLIRWLSKRSQLWGGARTLQQLGGLTLGPNKSLQVIEAGGRIYVVGVGENVTLLDLISEGEEADKLRQQLLEQRTLPQAASFTQLLRRLKNGKEDSQAAVQSADDQSLSETRRFQQLLHQKLEQQSRQQEELERLLQDSKDRDR